MQIIHETRSSFQAPLDLSVFLSLYSREMQAVMKADFPRVQETRIVRKRTRKVHRVLTAIQKQEAR